MKATSLFISAYLSRFPVTPDIVQTYRFDALLAKKYFVVCVPTVYDKLFPRLICCPDHEFFDPFHVDGCVHPLPPPPHSENRFLASNLIQFCFGPLNLDFECGTPSSACFRQISEQFKEYPDI